MISTKNDTNLNELDVCINEKFKTRKKIKFKCGFCGKKYIRHSLFERHFNACKTKDALKKKRKTSIETERERVDTLSLNRKLNQVLDILYVQSERIRHMEKMLESRNKIIKNKLKWLIENATPPKSFEDCLLNIELKKTHYDHLTKHGYLKGYCDLVEEVIDDYTETIYSFTTSNITYVYINQKEKWVEFNKNHAFQLFCKIQQKLLQFALTIELPLRIQLTNNAIIYGTNSQSIDIKTKIKTFVHKKTIIGMETLLNRYENNKQHSDYYLNHSQVTP